MDMYQRALYLAEKGIQTIPLDHNKKSIVTFKDIQITPSFIRTNEELYRSTTVLGCLTRDLWCIDIDKDHKDGQNGFESIEANPFAEEILKNATNTFRQVTPSGGLHLIFKKKNDVNYGQKLGYLDGVDIKAHNNNYFVFAGSVTSKGTYTNNDKPPAFYDGEFENRIFSTKGNFQEQIMAKYSVENVFSNTDFSYLPSNKGKGGKGKEAYQRIIDGQSVMRNNDLFLASSYAKQYNLDLEPLKILIGGQNSNGDVFTESEWQATVNSAN